MKPELEAKIARLYRHPGDLGLLAEVRVSLVETREFAVLAKLLHWWIGKQPGHPAIGEILFDAASASAESGAPDSLVEEMLQLGAKHQPTHEGLCDALAERLLEGGVGRRDALAKLIEGHVDALLTVDPGSDRAFKLLSWLADVQWRKLGDALGAERSVRHLIKLRPSDPRAHELLRELEPAATRDSVAPPSLSAMALLSELRSAAAKQLGHDPSKPPAAIQNLARGSLEELKDAISAQAPVPVAPPRPALDEDEDDEPTRALSIPSQPPPAAAIPSFEAGPTRSVDPDSLPQARARVSSMPPAAAIPEDLTPSQDSAPPTSATPAFAEDSEPDTAKVRPSLRSSESPKPAASVAEASVPPAVDEASSEDDDEDEEAPPAAQFEELVVPLERLALKLPDAPAEVHVRRLVGEQIADQQALGVAGRYRHPRGLYTLYRMGNALWLQASPDVEIARMAPSFTSPIAWPSKSRKPRRINPGEAVELKADGATVQVSWAPLRALPPAIKQPVSWRTYGIAAGLALTVHLSGLAGVAALNKIGVSLEVEDRPQEEIFAEGQLKKEPPKPIKRRLQKLRKRRAKKVAQRKQLKPQTDRKVRIPKSMRKKLNRISRKTPDTGSSANRMLNMLKGPIAGPQGDVSKAITSIDAVKGRGGGGSFKLSGTLAALGKGGGVKVAVGGQGGDVQTTGGAAAVGKAGRLTGGKGGGRTRGKVRGVQALSRMSGGSLSRGEVQKVINRSLGRIQRCYESRLASKPNLAGKISFNWKIDPNGSVSGVREASNSLGDAKVSSCIGGVIRRLRFPKPSGGSVAIRYPFIFQSN